MLHEMRRNMILMPLPAGQSVEWSFPQDGIQLNFSGTNQPWDMIAGMTINDIDTTNLAPEYTLYPHDYPFLGSYRLSILNDAKKWDPNAVMVYLEHPRSEWRYLGNRRAQNGYAMTSYALSFETFSVAVDTVQPFIRSVSPSDEIKLTSGQPMLQAVIGDDFSGLDLNLSELTVDSSDVIWEYDPDRALIFYRPWEPIEPGRHEWTIYVADNAGNTNTMTRYFTVR